MMREKIKNNYEYEIYLLQCLRRRCVAAHVAEQEQIYILKKEEEKRTQAILHPMECINQCTAAYTG